MNKKSGQSRFKKWNKPVIKNGKLTKWNWLVQHVKNLKLGKNVDIGIFTYINARYGIEIEDEVQIGSHCSLYTISTIDKKEGRIILRKNSRIGSHSVIMPGVSVGENTIVGAFSFVNKSLPADVVAVGCPVKILRRIKRVRSCGKPQSIHGAKTPK